MLCDKAEPKDIEQYENREYIAEKKLDGTRAIAVINNGEVRLIGRRGSCYNPNFPEIVKELNKLPNCILDGELIADNFNHLQSIVQTTHRLTIKLLTQRYNPKYCVFDVLGLNGENLKENPLKERKNILESLNLKGKNVVKIDYTTDIQRLWKEIVKNDDEGIVVKDMNSKYYEKRVKYWLKIKNFKEGTIIVNSYEFNPAGITATDGTHRVQIAGSKAKRVQKIIDKKGCCMLPIQYLEKTENGFYRFISFRG